MTYYAPESRLGIFLAIIMVMNFGMFFLHWIINSRYWSEYDKLFTYFSSFIRDKKDPDILPQDEEFDENARFLSLFKRTYIEQKLQKKDYNDFKNFLMLLSHMKLQIRYDFADMRELYFERLRENASLLCFLIL